MLYDEKCPICGTVNRQLNLDETNGWFICDKCQNQINNLTLHKEQLQPGQAMTIESITAYMLSQSN